MKKTIYSALLCSVFAAAAMAQPSVETKILDVLQNKILPDEVNYNGQFSIKSTASGYVVDVPMSALKTDKSVTFPGFTLNLTKEPDFKKNAQYKVTLTKLNQFSPGLEQLLKQQNVVLSSFLYEAKIVPSLNLMTFQMGKGENLQIKEGNGTDEMIKIASMTGVDAIEDLSGNNVKANADIALKGISLNHPFLKLQIDSLGANLLVPETVLTNNEMEQITNSPELKTTLKMTGLKASSFFLPIQSISFDADFSMDMKQDMQSKKLDITTIFDAKNVVVSGAPAVLAPKLPTALFFNINMKGFTMDELVALGQAQNRLREAKSVPFTRPEALKVMEQDVQNKTNAMKAKTSFFINKMGVSSDQYAISIRGALFPQQEAFNGTLTITNFDYISPAAQPIDEEACRAASEKWSSVLIEKNGNNQDVEVQQALRAAAVVCDDKAGVLDVLRPYIPTAKKVKDDNGKEALQFDIEYKNGKYLVNGQPLNMMTSDEMKEVVAIHSQTLTPLVP